MSEKSQTGVWSPRWEGSRPVKDEEAIKGALLSHLEKELTVET